MRQRVLHLGVYVFICVALIIGLGWQTSIAIDYNDVQLVRVYTREKEGKILKETFPSDAEFEVVVEAEAGEAIHGGGGKYFIQIVVRDLTDSSIVHQDSLEGQLAVSFRLTKQALENLRNEGIPDEILEDLEPIKQGFTREEEFLETVKEQIGEDQSVQYKELILKHADEPWDKPVLLYAFPMPAQGTSKENHIYEVLASLCVGLTNPNVSFAKSPMFIIHKP